MSSLARDIDRLFRRQVLALPPVPSEASEARFAAAALALCFGLAAFMGSVGWILAGAAGLAAGVLTAVASAALFARSRKAFSLPDLPAADIPLLGAPGDEHTGEVERSGESVDGPLSGLPCVVATVAVCSAGGARPYFWSGANPGFWLKREEGPRIFVAGPAWIDGPALHQASADGLPVAAALPRGILRGAVAQERRIEAAVRVSVSGTPRLELMPGVGYRDVEELVLRGVAGQPLVLKLDVARP